MRAIGGRPIGTTFLAYNLISGVMLFLYSPVIEEMHLILKFKSSLIQNKSSVGFPFSLRPPNMYIPYSLTDCLPLPLHSSEVWQVHIFLVNSLPFWMFGSVTILNECIFLDSSIGLGLPSLLASTQDAAIQIWRPKSNKFQSLRVSCFSPLLYPPWTKSPGPIAAPTWYVLAYAASTTALCRNSFRTL